ncbi:DUF6056 family protein [Enterobacter asburiae]|uniref:DUF6056 family protein n=1 Tax=Enterobacter asburiae TaxID=61645 RepID=UPI0034D22204
MKAIVRSVISIQAITVACIYVLTFMYSPLNGEDYGLTKRFTTELISERLSWALERSAHQIDSWNARLGEQLSIITLSLPDYTFLLVAVISIAMLCYVISTLLFDDENKSSSLMIGVIFVFLMWPGFELFTWRTVITGYTVPMLLTLAVIRKFMTHSRRAMLKDSKVQVALYCFVGFLSGLSFENVPVATIFFLFATLFMSKQLKTRLALVPVSVLAGWVLLVTAPSTTFRRVKYHEWYHKDIPFFDGIQARAIDVVSVFAQTSTIVFIAAILALAYLYHKKLVIKEHDLLLISSVLVVGSMVASPYTEARSFMFAWCVMIAFVVAAVKALLDADWRFNFAVLAIGFMALYVSKELYHQTREFYEPMHSRESFIEERLKSSECASGIKVGLVKGFDDYRYVNNRDEWYYYNLPLVSEYYGCKIVK